ncbi:MAG: methionyl-tRNA formyltransferase [Ignavibacteria bacterium]|nr:MAG: methionyl-tRNA formyltransferase [Ignavibacteria bacterium]KAF0160912.1 MAG: methionyl-tRNA formyltransferase [Ignavibacteria bacterium]
MKIVFMGTPEFAIPSLKKIIESKHEAVLVVSAPDKERGRGRHISFTPVKEFALKNNLEVLTPTSLNDEKFIARLKAVNADLFVVVAFRILPKEVHTIPKSGSFNLHGSLLPKYRGAAPIQWSIINGEKETGVTTFFLEDKVDTGNIILQQKIEVTDEDDLGTVYEKLMNLGADLVIETIDNIETGSIQLKTQDESIACPAPKITKDICKINWNLAAEKIHNLVRGLSPYPAAFFEHEGKNYKVYKSCIDKSVKTFSDKAGVLSTTKTEIFVQTQSGVLQLLELQPEGRKRMTAEEFLRGYNF